MRIHTIFATQFILTKNSLKNDIHNLFNLHSTRLFLW
jgi:hypothetical protein